MFGYSAGSTFQVGDPSVIANLTGITTVGDVLELLEKGEEAVMSIRNFGEKSLEELRQKMQEKGFLHDEKPTE